MTSTRVTVGINGSRAALRAAEWGAYEAQLRNLPLRLVTAVDTPALEDASDDGTADEHGKSVLAEARELVSRTAPGLQGETRLRRGPVSRVLLEESPEASLLVVGARGLGGVSPTNSGSTADIVAVHAQCPVAAIRGDEFPGSGPVLVGVDGSPVGERALAFAFDAAALRNAPLQALHAWSDAPAEPWVQNRSAGLNWDRIEDRERALLAERLAGRQEQHPDVEVDRVVVGDRPVRHLVEHAHRAQLVVVGSRGRGGFTGMLLGSTSQALLHSCPAPLVIVRYQA